MHGIVINYEYMLALIYDAIFCVSVDGLILCRVNPFDSTSDGDRSWQTAWCG